MLRIIPSLSILAPLSVSAALSSFGAIALTPTPAAAAGLEACGNIHLEASAQCEVSGGIECKGMCEPVAFEAACAADLTAMCAGMCSASATAMCTTDCSATCQADCTADPGSFECRGQCNADCQGSCAGSCMAAGNQGECQASCEATCEADCSASCEGVPPSANCDAQCMGCCQGSCEAEANLTCQIDCQASGYVDCKASLQGGCEASCETEEGALFCDGQYVDHGGNLADCVNALKELFNIEVSGYAEGSCSGGSCMGEAGGALSCSSSVHPFDERAPLALGFLVGLAMLGSGRRRRA